MKNNIASFCENYQKKLREQLRKHRIKLELTQMEVANAVGKSIDTYQRWESGKCLTDIISLLNVFQVLDFSTTEIIDILGLPPLTLCEIKANYQNEDILKNIEENGIYFAIRQKSSDIDDFTLGKLLVLLSEENAKRLKSKHGNP